MGDGWVGAARAKQEWVESGVAGTGEEMSERSMNWFRNVSDVVHGRLIVLNPMPMSGSL